MYTPFSSHGAFSGLPPPVFRSFGNNWKVTIAHTGHLSPLKLKPVLPTTLTVTVNNPSSVYTSQRKVLRWTHKRVARLV